MVAKDSSLRSLTSLQLVPPPKSTDDDNVDLDKDKWDPFPAPYAPHALREQIDDTRDDVEYYDARDDGEGQRRTPRRTSGTVAPTPPKIPNHRPTESAYYSAERQSRSRRSRSSSRTRLIKISANGSIGGTSKSTGRSSSTPRSSNSPTPTSSSTASPDTRLSASKKKQRSFSPMLTKGRLGLHLKEQTQIIGGNIDSNKAEKQSRPEEEHGNSIKSGSSHDSQKEVVPSTRPTSNQKIFMIGTSKVFSRSLIPPTVYQNVATDLWIVTINNNSKLASSVTNSGGNSSNDSVKAFSFRTEKEARASAYANAPPIMIPFDSCQECMLCSTKFTLFKRPRHCRNCGICVCSNYACSTTWSKRMIPETFNIKKEGTVKVCTSCDSLTKRFQNALLNGRYGTAVELYLTGNINLRVPFVFKDKKNKETMFPIHCAIEGKSEKLLRWLVDVQHCPIHLTPTGNSKHSGIIGAGAVMIKSVTDSLGTTDNKKSDFVPTLKTSKGRSVIDIAMKTQHVGILRYLITEKNVSVFEVEELDLALGAVEALAKAFPAVDGTYDPNMFLGNDAVENHGPNKATSRGNTEERKSGNSRVGGGSSGKKPSVNQKNAVNRANRNNNEAGTSPKKERIYSHMLVSPLKEKLLLPRDVHGTNTYADGLYGAVGGYDGNDDSGEDCQEEHDTIIIEDDNSVSTTVPEICILCQDSDVDCVATPCGHQSCCLTCSNQCLRCPICNLECHFIETYEP